MAYKSRANRLSDALSQIDEGMSEIEALTDEMEQWRDNMQGTNLESTERYSRVEEAAETLRQCYDDLENAKSELDNVEFPGMYG